MNAVIAWLITFVLFITTLILWIIGLVCDWHIGAVIPLFIFALISLLTLAVITTGIAMDANEAAENNLWR